MKKLLCIIISFILLISLVSCSSSDPVAGEESKNTQEASVDDGTQWAVYWYLCGSDLESEHNSATNDLIEMMEVKLPENIKVVIQTGGASVWHNESIDASKTQRFVYDSQGMKLVDEQPLANMGDPGTLTDFLSFARKNYPAERTAVIFWNHGGGSVTGAAFDELHGMDSLRLNEMYSAFTSVFGENKDNQPVDIIGFDTCLMATVDVAHTFSNIGKYLVASEELEPGNGWFYTGWLGALAENPGIEPLELSKVICDTYREGCELVGTEENITLSVTNLSKVNELIAAYNDFGKEALAKAVEDPAFFTHFSRIANATENYGGNTREQGYTNMADLGHLVRGAGNILTDTSPAVLAALKNCVEYKVNGKYREEATGLSCYYSYNGDVDNFNEYAGLGAGEAFKYFYAYGLTGELSQEGMKYIADMNYDSLPPLVTLDNTGWDNAPVHVDEEGFSTLNLGDKANDILSGVYYRLYYVDNEQDIMLSLGSDNDIIADWENGVFKDNFRGVWGSIDGVLVYMEIVYDCEDYNLYSIPILLNGEEYNLSVVYDFNTEKYEILGARKGLDEYGAADKQMIYLVEGDEIQTIHYASSVSDESQDFTSVTIDTIKVTPETSFAEMDLGDGTFIMVYEMVDSKSNCVYSQPITVEYQNGEITAYTE